MSKYFFFTDISLLQQQTSSDYAFGDKGTISVGNVDYDSYLVTSIHSATLLKG